MSDLLEFRKPPPPRRGKKGGSGTPDPGLIEQAEKLLELVKRGKVVGFFGGLQVDDGTITMLMGFGRDSDLSKLYLGCSRALHRAHTLADEMGYCS